MVQLIRRLAAVVATDVVGYSRLMSEDEIGTHRSVQSLHTDLMKPLIDQYNGRLVRTFGDGSLIEFASVLDAMICAIEIQNAIRARNLVRDAADRIHLRIGVNFGDLLVDGDDIFGEDVNIAVRLEAEADPGSIYFSEQVLRQIKGKVDAEIKIVGIRQLKNIPYRIVVHRIDVDSSAATLRAARAETDHGPVPVEKPSIAVHPFEDLTGHAGNSFFAYGLYDDIAAVLSRISGLKVITHPFGSVALGNWQGLDHDLPASNARYLLQGSFRQTGNRMRLNVRLLDTHTDGLVWAERYNLAIEDTLSVQDEIARSVITALSVNLRYGADFSDWSSRISGYAAWECSSRAQLELLKLTPEGLSEAILLSRRALVLDPASAFLKIRLGWALAVAGQYRLSADPYACLAEANTLLAETHGANDADPNQLALTAFLSVNRHEIDEAIHYGKRAIEAAPSSAIYRATLGLHLYYANEFDECLLQTREAMHLSPFYPAWFLAPLGCAYFGQGDLKLARKSFEMFVERNPRTVFAHVRLAQTNVALAESDRAAAAKKAILAIDPGFSVSAYTADLPYKFEGDRAVLSETLMDLGLPG